MTDFVLSPRITRPSRLRTIRDWFRQARIAASLRAAPPLPDRLLRDVGMEDGAAVPHSAPAPGPAADAPTRPGPPDLGCEPPRPPRLRRERQRALPRRRGFAQIALCGASHRRGRRRCWRPF